jgi:hypothetical protein
LTGAVVEIARDPAPLVVLRSNDRCGKLTHCLLGASQLVDQGAQQQHRYRKAGQKQLQGEDAPFGICVKKQARPMQRAPSQNDGHDEDRAARSLLAVAHSRP